MLKSLPSFISFRFIWVGTGAHPRNLPPTVQAKQAVMMCFTFVHSRWWVFLQNSNNYHLLSACQCLPKINRLPVKLGLLGSSKGEIDVCNLGEPHANPCSKGRRTFNRGEGKLEDGYNKYRVHGCQWLSPCLERDVFPFPVTAQLSL